MSDSSDSAKEDLSSRLVYLDIESPPASAEIVAALEFRDTVYHIFEELWSQTMFGFALPARGSPREKALALRAELDKYVSRFDTAYDTYVLRRGQARASLDSKSQAPAGAPPDRVRRTFRMPPDLHVFYKSLADAWNRTLTDVLRETILDAKRIYDHPGKRPRNVTVFFTPNEDAAARHLLERFGGSTLLDLLPPRDARQIPPQR